MVEVALNIFPGPRADARNALRSIKVALQGLAGHVLGIAAHADAPHLPTTCNVGMKQRA